MIAGAVDATTSAADEKAIGVDVHLGSIEGPPRPRRGLLRACGRRKPLVYLDFIEADQAARMMLE